MNDIPGTPEGPYTVVVSITPEIAERWLTKNILNRSRRKRVVDTYARDMAAGNWQLNGESIKWSADQTLLDGQHRLRAVVQSGATVRTFVTFNLPATTQRVMDTGAKRTSSDALGLAGYKYSALLASITKMMLAVKAGGYQNIDNFSPTTTEIADAVEADHSLIESAEFASRVRVKEFPSGALVGYAHWRMAKINPIAAEAFWKRASSKVGFKDGDPILTLVNRFGEARARRERLPKDAQLSLIFRAWNAYRVGRSLTILRINSSKGDGLIGVPEPR